MVSDPNSMIISIFYLVRTINQHDESWTQLLSAILTTAQRPRSWILRFHAPFLIACKRRSLILEPCRLILGPRSLIFEPLTGANLLPSHSLRAWIRENEFFKEEGRLGLFIYLFFLFFSIFLFFSFFWLFSFSFSFFKSLPRGSGWWQDPD